MAQEKPGYLRASALMLDCDLQLRSSERIAVMRLGEAERPTARPLQSVGVLVTGIDKRPEAIDGVVEVLWLYLMDANPTSYLACDDAFRIDIVVDLHVE
jgi:hypothetical protein